MLQFTQDMKIGIPLIDSQHKSMIEFANRLSAEFEKSGPSVEFTAILTNN